ncbi:hypothetical protein [Symmachiella dynata]|uniref:hypothetical protein n=1 Tax=Symmachiella dynata TaxID=2527995 RepID=UPI0030EF0D2D
MQKKTSREGAKPQSFWLGRTGVRDAWFMVEEPSIQLFSTDCVGLRIADENQMDNAKTLRLAGFA